MCIYRIIINNYMHSLWKPCFEKHFNLIEELTQVDESVYPPKELIFRVFTMNPEEIKIVLLGQDVYHQKGQANGLAFSVNNDVRVPPSLMNIFREIRSTFPERNYLFSHGNLERWFEEEKIFLLNCGLTVIDSKPGIHINKWKPFIDEVIQYIQVVNKTCIFVLLGNYAKSKMELINDSSRYITGVHPSPLSAHRGFFGSNIFKKIENKLGCTVNWNL